MGISVILALSLNLLYGYTGQLSFATGGFLGVGAYTATILTTVVGLPFLVSLIPAIVIPGLVAYVVGVPTLQLRGTDWVTSRAVSAGPDFLPEEGGWTVGFWPGMCWIAATLTGDDTLRAVAAKLTVEVAPRATDATTHDLGFVFMPSHLVAAAVTRDEQWRAPRFSLPTLSSPDL